jgi:hypothetical protein
MPQLLPDLDRSRALLVGYGDGQPWSPEETTPRLADALTSVFHSSRTQVLINPDDLSEVLDAAGQAAREASDVLLFHYSGRGDRHEQFVATGLGEVAERLSQSPAVRPVVILGSEEGSAAWSSFTRETLPWHDIRHPIALTLLAPTSGSRSAPSDTTFTGIITRALTAGIRDGPEVLELEDIRQAIDVHYLDHALSVTTESQAPPPGGAALRRGYKTPKLALGANPSASPPYQPRALSTDADAVYDYHWD